MLGDLDGECGIRFVLGGTSLGRGSFATAFAGRHLRQVLRRFQVSSGVRFGFIRSNSISTRERMVRICWPFGG